MSSSGRVGLVADDDAYFRMAVGTILNRQFGFSDVVEAASLDEALDCLSGNASISTALFDLSMPGMRTPANLRAVRESFPDTRIAVISGSSSRSDILMSLEAGVHGYMPKSLSIKDLAGALKTVFDGGIYVPTSLADTLSMPAQPVVLELSEATLPDDSRAGPPLTPRQQDVLDLLIRGKSNKEIAISLGLGEGTVKIHMAGIFRYFGVNSRAAAAVAGTRPYPKRARNLLGG